MTWWLLVLSIVLVAGILVLGFLAKDEDDRDNGGGTDPGAAIMQYREWKSQASSYAEMDEWNDAIDEARRRL